MSWYNPWGEIRTLKADLAEAIGANKDYHAAIRDMNDRLGKTEIARTELIDKSWSLRVENKRLESLMERAVFRSADTGRLLPRGRTN